MAIKKHPSQAEYFDSRSSSRVDSRANNNSQLKRNETLDIGLKTCLKIWSCYSKFIRSQCNKGRIVDSIYFGKFFKESHNMNEYNDDQVAYKNQVTDLKEFKARKDKDSVVEAPPSLNLE